MPVTNVVFVVLKAVNPFEVDPVGAVKLTESVTPLGIALVKAAVIFLEVLLVVTA